MRIGLISTESMQGGAARAMLRTMKALEAAGHEAVLITLSKDAPEAEPTLHVRDSTTGLRARHAATAHFFYNGRYVDRNRTPVSNTLFWIPAIGLDLSALVGRLGLDVLNIHWTSYFLSLESLDRLMALPAPIVFTLHDMAHFTGGCHYSAGCRRFEDDCAPCPQLRMDPVSLPARVRLRRARIHQHRRPWAIAPSHWLADAARSSGLFEPNHVVCAPNAIDLDVFSPQRRRPARAAFGLGPDERVILFGAFDNRETRKGFDLLIAAMRSFLQRPEIARGPPVTVLGVGSHLPALDLPGVKVVETGYIEDDDRLALAYSACDLAVVPSREDNLPNIMLEAMACGTPVAGFRIGGLPDLIEDGGSGALATPFDTEDLAEAMARVIARQDAGHDMRLAARRAAIQAASPSAHAHACVQVFEAARAEKGFARPPGQGPTRGRGWPSGHHGCAVARTDLGGPLLETAIRMRSLTP